MSTRWSSQQPCQEAAGRRRIHAEVIDNGCRPALPQHGIRILLVLPRNLLVNVAQADADRNRGRGAIAAAGALTLDVKAAVLSKATRALGTRPLQQVKGAFYMATHQGESRGQRLPAAEAVNGGALGEEVYGSLLLHGHPKTQQLDVSRTVEVLELETLRTAQARAQQLITSVKSRVDSAAVAGTGSAEWGINWREAWYRLEDQLGVWRGSASQGKSAGAKEDEPLRAQPERRATLGVLESAPASNCPVTATGAIVRDESHSAPSPGRMSRFGCSSPEELPVTVSTSSSPALHHRHIAVTSLVCSANRVHCMSTQDTQPEATPTDSTVQFKRRGEEEMESSKDTTGLQVRKILLRGTTTPVASTKAALEGPQLLHDVQQGAGSSTMLSKGCRLSVLAAQVGDEHQPRLKDSTQLSAASSAEVLQGEAMLVSSNRMRQLELSPSLSLKELCLKPSSPTEGWQTPDQLRVHSAVTASSEQVSIACEDLCSAGDQPLRDTSSCFDLESPTTPHIGSPSKGVHAKQAVRNRSTPTTVAGLFPRSDPSPATRLQRMREPYPQSCLGSHTTGPTPLPSVVDRYSAVSPDVSSPGGSLRSPAEKALTSSGWKVTPATGSYSLISGWAQGSGEQALVCQTSSDAVTSNGQAGHGQQQQSESTVATDTTFGGQLKVQEACPSNRAQVPAVLSAPGESLQADQNRDVLSTEGTASELEVVALKQRAQHTYRRSLQRCRSRGCQPNSWHIECDAKRPPSLHLEGAGRSVQRTCPEEHACAEKQKDSAFSSRCPRLSTVACRPSVMSTVSLMGRKDLRLWKVSDEAVQLCEDKQHRKTLSARPAPLGVRAAGPQARGTGQGLQGALGSPQSLQCQSYEKAAVELAADGPISLIQGLLDTFEASGGHVPCGPGDASKLPAAQARPLSRIRCHPQGTKAQEGTCCNNEAGEHRLTAGHQNVLAGSELLKVRAQRLANWRNGKRLKSSLADAKLSTSPHCSMLPNKGVDMGNNLKGRTFSKRRNGIDCVEPAQGLNVLSKGSSKTSASMANGTIKTANLLYSHSGEALADQLSCESQKQQVLSMDHIIQQGYGLKEAAVQRASANSASANAALGCLQPQNSGKTKEAVSSSYECVPSSHKCVTSTPCSQPSPCSPAQGLLSSQGSDSPQAVMVHNSAVSATKQTVLELWQSSQHLHRSDLFSPRVLQPSPLCGQINKSRQGCLIPALPGSSSSSGSCISEVIGSPYHSSASLGKRALVETLDTPRLSGTPSNGAVPNPMAQSLLRQGNHSTTPVGADTEFLDRRMQEEMGCSRSEVRAARTSSSELEHMLDTSTLEKIHKFEPQPQDTRSCWCPNNRALQQQMLLQYRRCWQWLESEGGAVSGQCRRSSKGRNLELLGPLTVIKAGRRRKSKQENHYARLAFAIQESADRLQHLGCGTCFPGPSKQNPPASEASAVSWLGWALQIRRDHPKLNASLKEQQGSTAATKACLQVTPELQYSGGKRFRGVGQSDFCTGIAAGACGLAIVTLAALLVANGSWHRLPGPTHRFNRAVAGRE